MQVFGLNPEIVTEIEQDIHTCEISWSLSFSGNWDGPAILKVILKFPKIYNFLQSYEFTDFQGMQNWQEILKEAC